jgi:hypothetical protein
MQETCPEARKVWSGRLLHQYRWLLERRREDENGSAFAFGIRLFATVALTLALISVAGYVLLERNMAQRQITDYAAAQRADAKALEREGARATSTEDGIADVDRLLEGVAERPGTREAFLIDKQHVIRAGGNDALVGTTYSDPRINAALEHGESYAGREADPSRDRRDFEFVTPIDLPSGRYAYEVTYDHRTYDAQLSQVRRILALFGLLALIGGSAVFYLVGGRRLTTIGWFFAEPPATG